MKDGISDKMYRAHKRFRNFPAHERRCVLDVFDKIVQGMGDTDCHYTSDIDRHVLSSLDDCIDGLAKVRDSLEKMKADGNLHLTDQNIPLHPQTGRQQQEEKDDDVVNEEDENVKKMVMMKRRRRQQQDVPKDVDVGMVGVAQTQKQQDVRKAEGAAYDKAKLDDVESRRNDISSSSSSSSGKSISSSSSSSSTTATRDNKDKIKDAFVMPPPQQIPSYVTQRQERRPRFNSDALLLPVTSTGSMLTSGFVAIHERVPADWKDSVHRVGRWLGVTGDLNKNKGGGNSYNELQHEEQKDIQDTTTGRYFYNSLSYSMDADDCWSGTHWCCVFIGDDQDFGCFEQYCPGIGYYCL